MSITGDSAKFVLSDWYVPLKLPPPRSLPNTREPSNAACGSPDDVGDSGSCHIQSSAPSPCMPIDSPCVQPSAAGSDSKSVQ
ncbi:hypothetical protein OV079_53355 [Nannocystis pusilla]|uniref:Uncharacterized protein n=1 Tax=Nannocystis pusilla TaxID=889268 RepID=A0A9X3F9C8_9BACT|nr:hypothetical protein [Nannocystis pusilla]